MAIRNMLFVHGTGVRGESYFRSLDLVARKVAQYLPEWSVTGCNWGEPFGARLNREGHSIPGYSKSGHPAPALEDADRARWHLLSRDPLLELRVLPEEDVIGEIPGMWIWQQIPLLIKKSDIITLIEPWGTSKCWDPFISALVLDPEWQN